MLLPKSTTMYVPVTKNGPNGIVLDFFNFPIVIKIIEIIEPKIEAINIYKITLAGVPTNNPARMPYLTSPPPIHLPCDI